MKCVWLCFGKVNGIIGDSSYSCFTFKFLVSDQSDDIRQALLSSGIVPAVVGLARCSQYIPILGRALNCLALLASSEEARRQLAKLRVVKVLLCALPPRPSPGEIVSPSTYPQLGKITGHGSL